MNDVSENLSEIINDNDPVSMETYNTVRGYIVDAQKKVKAAVNSAMVVAYWNWGYIS